MLGAELDFSDLIPGMEGLVIPFPDLEYSQPGIDLQPDPVYGEVFDTVTFPLIPFGADNSADPGDLITESYLWMIPEVFAYDNSASTGDMNFLFDTGAQLSVISTDMALELGLDLDQPETTIDVQGVAGTMTVPGYTLDFLDFTRDDGGTVRYSQVPVYVLDVAPGIDGIFGMNLMNVTSQFIFDPHHPDGAQLSVSYFSNPDRGGTIDDELGNELGALLSLSGMPVLGGALMTGAGLPGIGSTKYSPTTSLSLSPSDVQFGDSWSVTAALSFPDGAVAPTGSVEFRSGTTILATVPVDEFGHATWSFAGAAWDAGLYSISAVYSGDSKYHASSGSTDLTIQQAPATLSVSTDKSTAAAGQSVLVSGSLEFPGGTSATGRTVKLIVDGAEVATAQTAVGGAYEFQVSNLAVGSHEIKTSFDGETNFGAVTSSAIPLVITPAAAATLALNVPATAVYGQTVTLAASVGSAYAAAYEGVDVKFFVNGTLLGSSAFASGVASLPFTASQVGTSSITATVSAIGTYPALSTPEASAIQVGRANVSIAWTVVNAVGGMTEWVITVQPVSPGAGTPTGFIRIASRASRATLRTLQIVNGRAIFRFRGQANAPASITYFGDSKFNGIKMMG